MPVIRRFLAQRRLAALLCVATLLLKLLVPGGYMVGGEHGRLTITLCTGVATMPMTMEMPGMPDGKAGHVPAQDHGKAEMPCAFSALAALSLGAVDPIQLVALIAFVMAVGLCPAFLPRIIRPARLRPPLRGPPAAR